MIPARVTYTHALFPGIATTEIAALDVSRLRNTPLNEGPSLTMIGPHEKSRQVKTIREMEDAEREGFYASTNADMAGHSYFRLVSDLLDAVLLARESKATFLVPISRADLLPARYLSLYMNTEDPDYLHSIPSYKNLTIAEMAKGGIASIIESGPVNLQVRAGVDCHLVELLRGDLDGDGIEDMLVWQGCRAIGGSMAWGSSIAFTRLDNAAPFSTARLPFR